MLRGLGRRLPVIAAVPVGIAVVAAGAALVLDDDPGTSSVSTNLTAPAAAGLPPVDLAPPAGPTAAAPTPRGSTPPAGPGGAAARGSGTEDADGGRGRGALGTGDGGATSGEGSTRTATRAATRTATASPGRARRATPAPTSRPTTRRTAAPSDGATGGSRSAPLRGQATHYGPAAAGGACSFPTLPSPYTAAVGPSLYRAAGGCGAVLDVTGPGGTLRVTVDNLCPECREGHLDLTDEAFARLAPLGRGLIPVTYRLVSDPPVQGGLQVRVKEGSSQYWLAVLVGNTGNRLRSVAVRFGSSWRPLERQDYNYWLAPQGAGEGPFTLRVQDVEGHVAVVPGVRLSPGAVQRTNVRLY